MRALVASLAAVLVMVRPAAVLAAPVPVEGGGSFNDAPVVAPGSYADTIKQAETLFYAVELAQGQRLTASVQIAGQPGSPRIETGTLVATLHTPAREADVVGSQSRSFNGVEDARAEVRSGVIGVDQPRYRAQGRYFLAVELKGNSRPTDRDYAIELTFRVDQEVASTTSSSTVATTTASTAPPKTTASDAALPGDGTGPGDGGWAFSWPIGVACLVVGAVLGVAFRRLATGRRQGGTTPA